MTGREAWSVVAPILAAHMTYCHEKLDALDEAYVIVFGALNLYDEEKKWEKDNVSLN